jgi:Flp pilus assembly protein TadG
MVISMKISKFIRHVGGNFAVTAAVAAPAMFGTIGLGMDFVLLHQQEDRLQEAADAAALASVRELGLAGSPSAKAAQVQQVAESYAYSAFFDNPEEGGASGNLSVEATTDDKTSQVEVNLSYTWTPMFAQYFNSGVTPIKVSASAELAGGALTCVVGLMPPQLFAKASIHLDNSSYLKADNCAVFSNSTSRYGLRADADAKLHAQSICSAGGVITFGKAEFLPRPITDCPKVDDPLESRVPPAYGGCTDTNLVITGDSQLTPGVYCGGLTISDAAVAKLDKGNYIIKDGPLIVKDTATLQGKNVSFFLTGDGSVVDFGSDTTIDLEATDTGSMAGLLFFEDRNVNYSFNFNPFNLTNLPAAVRLHKISSNNANNLLGTVYLPRGILLIDANQPVADASAYTAIIVGRLWLTQGPTLTLNSDYTDTTVPVPGGLLGTRPILVH